MKDFFQTYKLKFRELGPEHFIWLPLKNVPITEQFPINSLEQPALSIFRRADWSAVNKFETDNQKYLAELASQYDEMGYFLLHNGDDFGIIGVDECDYDYLPGRATIFNARHLTIEEDENDFEPTMLNIIHTSVQLPWKEVVYDEGNIVYWGRIIEEYDCGNYYDD